MSKIDLVIPPVVKVEKPQKTLPPAKEKSISPPKIAPTSHSQETPKTSGTATPGNNIRKKEHNRFQIFFCLVILIQAIIFYPIMYDPTINVSYFAHEM